MPGFPYNPALSSAASADALEALVTGGVEAPVIPESAPRVLLGHWEADAPGTIDTDGDAFFPSVVAWRDKLNGFVLRPASLAFAPSWINASTMPSARPAVGFSGAPEFLLGDEPLRNRLKGLTGASVSLVIATGPPPPGILYRQLYMGNESPRLALAYSGLSSDKFYAEGSTNTTDPYNFVSGGTTLYDGWATQTIRRNYLNGGLEVFWNGETKIQAPTFGVPAVGSAVTPDYFIVGSGVNGESATVSHIYAIKLYTYAISDDIMNADNLYGGGRINA